MPDLDDLVDRDALASYLEELLGPADRFEVERCDEGFSNETLFVDWGDDALVIRRPPPGATADTAHDVLREYRPMDALQDTDVPVPETLDACEDQDVLGCDFYVMRRLDGDVVRWSEPDRFARPEARRRVGEQLVDTLAAIHTVDHEAVGLGDFGRPEGFAERQVERWTEQFEWAFEETWDDRPVPTIKEVGDWLADNVPSDHPHALVHGDYKLDNVIWAPSDEPEIVGVLDWEMSTLGDPLTDLGWMLFFWFDEGDPESKVMQTFASTFLRDSDYPTRRELVERYEEATGFSFENHRFYRTLAAYKMAALGEMFYARYLMGHSDSTFYQMMEDGVPALAETAQDIAEGEFDL